MGAPVPEEQHEAATRRTACDALDAAVAAGLDRLYPGAVLMVAHRGVTVHARAFGAAQLFETDEAGAPRALARPRPMRLDTPFDLASITKVAATTLALLHLVGRNRLALDDRLGRLLPCCAGGDKADLTLRQLLAHRAGLWEWQPAWRHLGADGSPRAFLAALPLRYPAGERHAYSDLGFMLLGEVVARVGGAPLDRAVASLHHALGLRDTGFGLLPGERARAAATSRGDAYQRGMAERGVPFPPGPIAPAADAPPYRRHVLVGEANDANVALAWNGVAGHAGLFGTAADLLRLAGALCARDPRLAPPETFAAFEARPFDAHQALGLRAFAVDGLAEPFFGHTGFTGTFFAYHRPLSLAVALLTNREHRSEVFDPPPPLAELHACVLQVLAGAFAQPDGHAKGRKQGRAAGARSTGDSA